MRRGEPLSRNADMWRLRDFCSFLKSLFKIYLARSFSARIFFHWIFGPEGAKKVALFQPCSWQKSKNPYHFDILGLCGVFSSALAVVFLLLALDSPKIMHFSTVLSAKYQFLTYFFTSRICAGQIFFARASDARRFF